MELDLLRERGGCLGPVVPCDEGVGFGLIFMRWDMFIAGEA